MKVVSELKRVRNRMKDGAMPKGSKSFFLITLSIIGLCSHSRSQTLTDTTSISIVKYWPQEPAGFQYPISIHVPEGVSPTEGHPVCIILHGNGGNGINTLAQFQNVLECHILVAPTGYGNSWNICSETSDAPDIAMLNDLINIIQGYSNVDVSRIRILGFSNGAGLTNRAFIENTNTGVDIMVSVVSQLNEPQFHNGTFHKPPGGGTNPAVNFCSYSVSAKPLTDRKYLSICNVNDPIIPYSGGASVVGVDFLDAEEAGLRIAESQGYTGTQIITGTQIGLPQVTEFSYLSGQVVHLKGDAEHGINETQENYIKDFLSDCSIVNSLIDEQTTYFKIYPNPSSGMYQVQGTGTISVHSVLGELILSEIISSSSTIDLSGYANGIYTLQLQTAIGTITRKLVKK